MGQNNDYTISFERENNLTIEHTILAVLVSTHSRLHELILTSSVIRATVLTQPSFLSPNFLKMRVERSVCCALSETSYSVMNCLQKKKSTKSRLSILVRMLLMWSVFTFVQYTDASQIFIGSDFSHNNLHTPL